MIVVDEYIAVRVLRGRWPAGLPDDEDPNDHFLPKGEWSVREIRSKMVDDPARTAAVIARSGVAGTRALTADEIHDAAERFLEVWEDTGYEGRT